MCDRLIHKIEAVNLFLCYLASAKRIILIFNQLLAFFCYCLVEMECDFALSPPITKLKKGGLRSLDK